MPWPQSPIEPMDDTVLDTDRAEALAKLSELAIRLLTEGLERGEDRRQWTLDVLDADDAVVMTLTLAEAAGDTGLVSLH